MSLRRKTFIYVTTCALMATGLGAAVTTVPAGAATVAQADPVNEGQAPCTKVPNLKGKKPGQLLASQELPVNTAQLSGGRLFRIMHTTSGVDEKDVKVSCALVVIPKKEKNRTNKAVAWAHGTVGVHQQCQPSNDPIAFLNNLGPITYGQGADAVTGQAKYGILQGFMDQGRLVTATDYYSGLGQPASAMQSYLLGVPAGAAVLDSVRAGIQLQNSLAKKSKPSSSWKMALWGASQGGQAALWAGQLAQSYLKKTKLKNQPKIDTVGVVAAVPASSFVATDQSPQRLVGRHLGDLEMHLTSSINGFQIPIGPFLFSFVIGTWSNFPGSGKLVSNAKFPAYDKNDPNPQMDGLLTQPDQGGGIEVAQGLVAACPGIPNLAPVLKYLDPAKNAFFDQPVWGGPTGPGGQWEGQLDKTCLNPDSPKSIKTWCRWLAFNQPGPDGENPYNKIPKRANGKATNIMIVEGMDDDIVYCNNPNPTVPDPADCMSRQLYDSLAPACKASNVSLKLFATGPKSPANHFSTYKQIANNGNARYKGSPMDKFIKGSFKGSLKPGCSAKVVNK